MSVILADSAQKALTGGVNPLISAQLYNFAKDIFPYHAALQTTSLLGGAGVLMTSNLPVTGSPQVIACDKPTSYRDDKYYRIHIIPDRVDVGNLVSEQLINIEVWNSYFVTKHLDFILGSASEGLTLIGQTAPADWNPLQSRMYQLLVGLDGPPTINASFLFDWTGTVDDHAITITGKRIVSLPFVFESPARESLEWRTNVVTSNDGTEQRIRLRKAPRQGMDVTYPLRYGDMQRAENVAYNWLKRTWAIPMWNEAQAIATLASGATVIPVDTTAADFRADGLVYIFQDKDNNVTAEIISKTNGTLTLSKPLGQAYTNPWVMPVRTGRNIGNMVRRSNGREGSLDAQYEFGDNIDLAPGASAVQFLGYDVLLDENIQGSDDFKDTLTTRIDVIDYGLAQSASQSGPWKYTRASRPHRWVLQGLPDIWAFRTFLHRRAGRLRPFWQPTFENNLRLNQTGLLGNALAIRDDDYKNFGSARNHIGVRLADGTWLLRTITNVTAGTGGNSTITLDTSLNVDASLVRVISFLTLKRFDTDRVELLWESNRTVTCEVRVLEIQP